MTFSNPPINLADPDTILSCRSWSGGSKPTTHYGLSCWIARIRTSSSITTTSRGRRRHPSTGTDRPARLHRHHDPADQLSRRDHRVHPGSHPGRGRRAGRGMRHAVRQPGAGHLRATGSGCGTSSWRRRDRTAPACSSDGPGHSRLFSAVTTSTRRRRRLRLDQPRAPRRRTRRLRRQSGAADRVVRQACAR